jgi:hypothetical protein
VRHLACKRQREYTHAKVRPLLHQRLRHGPIQPQFIESWLTKKLREANGSCAECERIVGEQKDDKGQVSGLEVHPGLSNHTDLPLPLSALGSTSACSKIQMQTSSISSLSSLRGAQALQVSSRTQIVLRRASIAHCALRSLTATTDIAVGRFAVGRFLHLDPGPAFEDGPCCDALGDPGYGVNHREMSVTSTLRSLWKSTELALDRWCGTIPTAEHKAWAHDIR